MISILDHISQDKLDKLCEQHYAHVLKPSFSPHIIRDELKKVISIHGYNNPTQVNIVSYILNNFKSIISSKPINLENHISYFKSRGYDKHIEGHINKPFRVALLNAFAYEKFRKWDSAVKLAQGLDLKSCPYCNAQYTLVTKQKSKNKLAFQLDHFYPKSHYPYLSLSFYNLIPCCSVCNNSKSNKPTNMKGSYHPYSRESVSDDFSFCTDNLDVVKAYVKGKTKFSVKINDEEKLSVKAKKHLDDYSIKKLFERHDDIVEEIVWKKFVYVEEYKKQIRTDFGPTLFLNEYDLERFIIGNYTKKEDTHKRPLSKFASDIARDLGLIR